MNIEVTFESNQHYLPMKIFCCFFSIESILLSDENYPVES